MPSRASKTPVRQRREPRQARSRATVEAIVAAGARVLARQGWAGFTTNAVANRAGVSIGSLYEYFRDKQAIADAIVERHLARGEALLAERGAALLNQGGEARMTDAGVARLVAALVDGFVALHADDPRLHRVLAAEVPLSPRSRRRVAALGEAVVSAAARALAGVVHEPQLVARLLVDTADALTHRWIVDAHGRPVPADRLAGELTTMLSAYLTARAASGRE